MNLLVLIAILVTQPAWSETAARAKIQAAEIATMERPVRYATRLEPIRRIVQMTPFSGVVKSIQAQVGKRVEQGTSLAQLERYDPSQGFRRFEVKARISGVINQVMLRPGMEFNQQEPILEIVDTSLLKAQLWVSDKDRAFVKRFSSAKAWVDDAGPYLGRVTRVMVAPNPATGLFGVEAEFKPIGPLRSGLYTYIDVGNRSFEGIVLPRSALHQKAKTTYVYLASDEGTAIEHPVTIRAEHSGKVGVEGIQVDQKVIVGADRDLRTGMKVIVPQKKGE